jgi:hypothetical protein
MAVEPLLQGRGQRRTAFLPKENDLLLSHSSVLDGPQEREELLVRVSAGGTQRLTSVEQAQGGHEVRDPRSSQSGREPRGISSPPFGADHGLLRPVPKPERGGPMGRIDVDTDQVDLSSPKPWVLRQESHPGTVRSNAVRLPYPADGGVTHARGASQGTRRPMCPAARPLVQRLGQDCPYQSFGHRRRGARSKGVFTNAFDAEEGEPGTPTSHRDRVRAKAPSDLPVGAPLRRQQHDSGPHHEPVRGRTSTTPAFEERPLPLAERLRRGPAHESSCRAS